MASSVSEGPNVEPGAGRPPMRRGATLFFVSTTLSQVAALVRYVVLARLLGPEQLGVAATLVVTGSFFDLISDTGSDRFLIQDPHGDKEEVQRLVQAVWVVRGMMIATSLVLFSIPLAHFYNNPKLAVGFATLALSPLILGFTHMDIRRLQRGNDFFRESICSLTSEATGLAVTVVSALLFRDFTAVLYGLITRASAMALMSHVVARRPYRLAWSSEHGPRLRRFSMPLMLSGLMLFIGSQGDRVIVGREVGILALGQYSAVILLIFYPSAVLLRYMHVVFMPIAARAQANRVEINQVSDTLGGQTLLLAAAMAVGFAALCPFIVPFLYGSRYKQSAMIIGLIGILQTTRFLINWPTTIALSIGRSRTVLISNLARLMVFPGVAAGFWLWSGLLGVVTGFIVGEMFSIAISILLLNRDLRRPWRTEFDRLIIFLTLSAVVVGWNLALRAPNVLAIVGLAVASVAIAAWLMVRERRTLIEILQFARTRFH